MDYILTMKYTTRFNTQFTRDVRIIFANAFQDTTRVSYYQQQGLHRPHEQQFQSFYLFILKNIKCN